MSEKVEISVQKNFCPYPYLVEGGFIFYGVSVSVCLGWGWRHSAFRSRYAFFTINNVLILNYGNMDNISYDSKSLVVLLFQPFDIALLV